MKLFYILILYFYYLSLNSTNVQAQSWNWAEAAGLNSGDRGYSIVTDNANNVYVTGWFASPSITFGATTLINTGVSSIFLVKYDALGNVLWAKNTMGNNTDVSYGIACDNNGNVFVTGAYTSSLIIFESDTLVNAGSFDIFVAKYDASGNLLWVKNARGNVWDSGWAIATDDLGNIYVTGQFFSDSLFFGNDTLINQGYYDIYIVKYDAAGNVQWAKNIGSQGSDQGYGITVDNSNNIYLTGVISTLTNNVNDVYIGKFDSSGNQLWAKATGGTDSDVGYGIVTDGNGFLYVTGRFRSPSLIFNSNTIINSGGDDILILKYDTSGNELWAKSAGGTDHDWGMGITCDASGNVYLTGHYNSSSISFGNNTLNNFGSSDIFVVKYNTLGNVLWSKSAGGPSYDASYEISLNTSGNVYITGWFTDSIIFDNFILISSGSEDIFVAMLDATVTGPIAEENDMNILQVYPNPSSGQIKISCLNIITDIKIINTLGQIIYIDQPGTNNISLELFTEGIYLIKIITNKAFITKKVLIKN